MFLYHDRIRIIKEKRTWNDKKILAKIGQKATIIDPCPSLYSEIRIQIDGHSKGMWIRPSYIEKIEIDDIELLR